MVCGRSVGPLGKLFGPRELTDDAYEAFALQVKALADGGVDVINLDIYRYSGNTRRPYRVD